VPLNLTVNAEVVDIRGDAPKDSDVFLVDTNVWFWLTYTRVSLSDAKPYQTTDYPDYVQRALTTNALLSFCGVNLAELAGVIEQAERKIHNGRSGKIESVKYFRHNFPAQRIAVTTEISTAFSQVESMASAMDVMVNGDAAKNGLAHITRVPIDLDDAVMLEVALKNGVNQVLTDDCDFVGMNGITVFTANRTVLAAATATGRIKVR
jgi:predicted nucleic acid-binding protein